MKRRIYPIDSSQEDGDWIRQFLQGRGPGRRPLFRLPMPSTPPPTPAAPSGEAPDLLSLLAGCAENLTARMALGGQLEAYQREAEIQQVLQALASPLKGRVVVTGPRRAGKTIIIEAAAARIRQGQCPAELMGREIWRLTPDSLPGLSPGGPWQPILDHLMREWAGHPEVILYFDEITRAARLPGGADEQGSPGPNVAGALAAALRRASGQCLAEAEEDDWRRFAESYSDFGEMFLAVRVAGLEPETTQAVVTRVAGDLGILHGLTVAEAAVAQAIDLSQRYALDRAQPGKSIDLLRDTLAVTPAGQAQVTPEDVTRRFREQSGLPPMLLDDAVGFNEDEVLRYFKQRVLGQEQAVEAILQSLSLLRARVHNPRRPMGVFLFLGPTGVGKTELARTLAEYLYGNADRLIRFNMADYPHPDHNAELFGAAYGRDLAARRGQITNRLAGRMFAVIVLDEFEKANRYLFQRFLQLFDEGVFINGNDETVNLRNAIFILTSNFGARLIEQEQIGFNVRETPEMREKRVLSETEEYFTPEFINRIDAVCIFHPLNRQVMAEIARREIGDLLRRDGLTRRRIEVEIADEVIEHVVAVGYSPHYGARYLKRQIEKTITYPLARELNALAPGAAGGALRLFARHGRVLASYLPPVTAQPAAPPAPPSTPFSLDEVRAALPILAARVEALETTYRVDEARQERDQILGEMTDVGFWNDQALARRKLDVYQRASGTVDLLAGLRQALDTLAEECAQEAPSAERLLRAYRFLQGELPRVEFAAFLSGPYDVHGAYLTVAVRSRQPAARHWAADLAKMYLGWARQRGLTAAVLGEDTPPDGRAFSATLVVSGFGVYGLLQGEAGAHRLSQLVKVRGQESQQRLTAAVSVLPELGEDDLPPAPAELEVVTRSFNRGGLLIPHLSAQATARLPGVDRRLALASDLPADDLAAETARLLRLQLLLEAEPARLPSAPGGVVRSYVRDTRDKGVVDHRTGLRSARLKQVLEGDLQAFLDAGLRQRAAL